MTMDERITKLLRNFPTGSRVYAIQTIVYGTGEEIAEGTKGRVQQTNVHGCTPLVTVAWDGRGGPGQPPHIYRACSIESLEFVPS